MKFNVMYSNKYSPEYLLRISCQVYGFLQDYSVAWEEHGNESFDLIGPDGIRFCIRGDRNENEGVVNVTECGFGFVALQLPRKLCDSRMMLPPWLEFARSNKIFYGSLYDAAPLYFGQILIGDAAQLFNVPADFLEENFQREQLDSDSPNFLLPLSITRNALYGETYVDIRGFAAWLTAIDL